MRPTTGFYAIVDPDACGGRDPVWVAEQILRVPVAAVQLRAKSLDDRQVLDLGAAIASRARAAGVPFVVDDRPDLAVALGADGLHLGQRDVPIEIARRITGSAMHIAVSTHTTEQALDAVAHGADAIGFGPIFETRSKRNPDPVVGLAGLRAVARAVTVPIIAIGGIDATRAPAVRDAGAAMWAAISAVCAAPSPLHAARELGG